MISIIYVYKVSALAVRLMIQSRVDPEASFVTGRFGAVKICDMGAVKES